nr:hypothetical protein [Thermoanaerobaculia bacterium]
MKKLASTTALALAVIVLARPASAQSYGSSYHPGNAIRLDLGAFQPEASSSYWDGVFEDFRGDKNDFRDVSFGVEYQRDLSGPWLLMAGIHGFDTTVTQSYRRFVDNNDRPIRHDTNLQLATATFGFAVRLSPRGAPVVPYLGAGAALVSWELEEKGDFIDFEAQPRRVFSARFNDDGVAYGW